MKKSLCFLLVFVLLALCVTPTAFASDADKISPAVRALIEENSEGGVVVEIFHHNADYPTEGVSEQEAIQNNLKAHKELLAQIEEITYMEADGFSIGRFYIGLPYESIEKVAAFENVDYIDLPHDDGSPLSAQEKLDDRTKTALEKLSPDTKVNIILWLAYNEHAYIGMAEPGKDCTLEQAQEYLRVMRAAKKAYISEKNQACVQVIKSVVSDAEFGFVSGYVSMISVTTTLSEVEKIASFPEVSSVNFEAVVYIPSEDPESLEDKFENWMYTTSGLTKSDPQYKEWNLENGYNYTDYREIYVTDDWALVYAVSNQFQPWDYVEHIALCNRVLSWYAPGAAIYPYGYFVYNAKEDTFHPIERFVYPTRGTKDEKDENGKYIEYIIDPVISLDDYPGLPDVLDAYNVGAVRGDADGDGERTVLDATVIQRYKADIIAETGLDVDASDADGDNETTVLDATRIQRTIADLCDITGELKVLNPLF